MMNKKLSFDEVFKIWLEAEIVSDAKNNLIKLAQSKGFSSIAEWRLNTAKKLGLDKKIWTSNKIKNPNKVLPKIIIGPYEGWSKFFNNNFRTTFAEAMLLPEFFDWCKTHDRVNSIARNFPMTTTIIVLKKPNGNYIHIEGGHRICALAYRVALGKPIKFEKSSHISIVSAPVSHSELRKFKNILISETGK